MTKITIFLNHGETLRFENVKDYQLTNNGTQIEFNYTSMSDNKVKHAIFRGTAIAGTSVWEE